jgi:ATP-dependent exoDNAse (exonuclease V) alpha subunit
MRKHAPREYADRAVLWNAVEKTEKAKNSQLAREIEIALPRELTRQQNILLARRYVQEQFVSAGMCADLCIHDTGKGNPHAHIMLTMRPFNEDKTWGTKQKKEYILDESGGKIYDPKKAAISMPLCSVHRLERTNQRRGMAGGVG